MTTLFARYGLRIERPRSASQFFDRRMSPHYCMLGIIFAYVILACALTEFDLSFALLAPLGVMAIYVTIGVVLRAYGLARFGGLCELIALFCILFMGAGLISLLLLSVNAPLVDSSLAAADLAWFGFDRELWVGAMPTSGWLHFAIAEVYRSFAKQPFVLLPLLFLAGQEERARTFVLAWAAAVVATVAFVAVAPALGTPPYQYEFEDVFHGVRNGTVRLLEPEHMTGVVTFPSFHAAAAVLFAWGAAGLRRGRLLFFPLNALMFASALLVGGHYLVDLLAGAVVAAAGILLAVKVQRRFPAAGDRRG